MVVFCVLKLFFFYRFKKVFGLNIFVDYFEGIDRVG